MTTDDMSPELKKFLEEDCKAGDYAMMTIMVNKQHLKAFVKHFQDFQARLGLIQNGTGKGIVLGMDGKPKLGVLDGQKGTEEGDS